MKRLQFIFLLLSFFMSAQVGIGTTSPNNKAMLDITSLDKGVLIPRLTFAQITAISPTNLENGLFVYNTNENCINFWNGSSWQSLCGSGTPGSNCDPSTFADFTIDCNQFPVADTNTYSIGLDVTGNSVTVAVNVTKIGPYSLTITSDNGVTYQKSGVFSITGPQNVVVDVASGAPSSATLNFTVRANGISVCQYTKTATGSFGYTYTCGSYSPSSIPFTIGTATSGTFTIPVSVVGTGDIPSQTSSSNGITFVTTAIPNATSTNTTVTVNYNGTPTASPIQFNIGSCPYAFTAEQAFSYSYDCSNTTPSSIPEFIIGVSTSGSFTIPVTTTGIGSIPPINQTINGITFTSNSTTVSSTSSTTSITINYTGTATDPGTNELTLNNSNSTSCKVPFTSNYGSLIASGCSTSVAGNYIVETPLTSGNTITVTYSGITRPGYVNLVTEDKNGMKWASNGNVLVTTTNPSVVLSPVVSNTKLFTITGDSVPNTSEEVSDGANGANNQTASYAITNTYNNADQTLGCSATVDVKPAYNEGIIVRTAWASTNANTQLLGVNDSRVQLYMAKLEAATTGFWKVMGINKSGSLISEYSGLVTSSRDSRGGYSFSGTNWANNSSVGSFDVWAQSGGSLRTYDGGLAFDIGAHAAWGTAMEQSDAGIVLKIGNLWYKYRFTYNSTTAEVGTSAGNTTSIITLYGVYTSKPTHVVTDSYTSIPDVKTPYKSYWP